MSYRFILLITAWFSCSSALLLTSRVEGAIAMESEPPAQINVSLVDGLTLTAQTSPSPASTELLKVGSQGARVRELQALLQQLGYDVTPDGSFGEATRDAVIDFQKKKGLPADGQVGRETFDLLEEGFSDTLTDLTGIPTEEAELEPESPAPSPDASAAAETLPPSVGVVSPQSPADRVPTTNARSAVNVRQMRLGLGVLLIVSGLVGTLAYLLGRGYKTGWWRSSIKTPAERRWASPPPLIASNALDSTSHDERSPSVVDSTAYSGSTNGSNGYTNGTGSSHEYVANSLPDMARLPRVDIGEELIKDLQSPDPTRRRKAIWDLGQHGDSRAVQPLVELMIDSDSNQRNLILAALSEIGMRTMKPMNRALMISLEDENSDVRKNAIRDVTRVYEQLAQITTILRHAIDDRDQDVQQTAHWALGQINRIRALPEAEPSAPASDSSYAAEVLPHDSSS